MEVRKVGVVGCGTMGSGICEVVARAGVPVSFVEVSPERVEAGLERIRSSLARAVRRDKLGQNAADELLSRIAGDTAFDVLADADLVVEAVPEQLDIKQETFATLDRVCKPEAILATNTSSLSVMDLAVHTTRSNRVVGFHFFNPAPVMKLIELIRTVVTDDQVLATVRDFAQAMGKTPVVARDRAGFVANLLLFPYLNQAVQMHESGYATREDIDAAMQLGCGHPMGPLALMDLIGLDSGAAIMETMYAEFGDPRHAPRPAIRQLLAAEYRGRKSGRGFYTYEQPNAPATTDEGVVAPEPVAAETIASWRRVGIVGSGAMATGIAEVCARAGYDVVVRARTAAKAAALHGVVGRSLTRGVERGKLDHDAAGAALARIHPTADLAALDACDLVVEAIVEDLETKRELFARLDEVVKPDALLATTTSSLPVIACAMATARPERVVGMHFFNPAAVMRLVELVTTVRTDAAAVAQACAFAETIGKHAVRCRDRAGFIVNALLFPYLNDAIKMLEEGYATVAEIDTAMKLGCGHPLGPFELIDVVGLDVTLQICRALHGDLREDGYAPAPLLSYMVSAGYLGRKAGRGFYVYS